MPPARRCAGGQSRLARPIPRCGVWHLLPEHLPDPTRAPALVAHSAPAASVASCRSVVGDRDWPGEYLLDISTTGKRRALGRITSRWMDVCVAHGFRAVRRTTWTRGRAARVLDWSDTVAMSRILVPSGAPARGLAVAQKDTAELASRRRRRLGLRRRRGARSIAVRGIVHGPTVGDRDRILRRRRSAFDRACAARGAGSAILYRDHQPRRAGARQYRFALRLRSTRFWASGPPDSPVPR